MEHRLLLRYGMALLGAATLIITVAGVASTGSAAPRRPCSPLAGVELPNTTIVSVSAVPATGPVPTHCAIQLYVTNPPARDRVNVAVWLPDKWNGRFQGTGGGGFVGGNPTTTPGPALQAGYAVAATDTGHTGGSGSFALNTDGTLNWQLIADNGYLGIHEMTVSAKALVRTFYAKFGFRSYFNGCSTGGRQGLMEAQRYPDDYDGIAAGSPAINWTKLHPSQLWGQLQMLLAGNPIPTCKLAAATQAAIKACDSFDGLTDGIVADWQHCRFDARSIVGTETTCGTITNGDAELINKMWDGPRGTDGTQLWYGLERDADLTALNNAAGPFAITLDWFRYFLKQDPAFDWRTLTYDQYLLLFQQSVLQYQAVIATDDPDLSAFRDSGGKVVFWHGTADQLIYFRGSVDYYQRVEAAMGGPSRTGKFARFFVAPGVTHCGGGAGAAPVDVLSAVVAWVEKGTAPDVLAGRRTDATGNVVLTRPICRYPLIATYTGSGPADDQKNFTCTRDRHR
ncbi:tannase/feruloyl esterase family alpha/beta hydrolase [Actinoplanes sp. NPDC051513]|uniref:tannase/feruloyl esterase family alpha/beta hydrolase n=1 Tax=Actinoplanes sp. NPDC051513 TaxID=3363908 RepID=UPI0037ACB7DC